MHFLINIAVDDLERAIDFYRDAFDRRVGHATGRRYTWTWWSMTWRRPL